jgi:hypothetical protein
VKSRFKKYFESEKKLIRSIDDKKTDKVQSIEAVFDVEVVKKDFFKLYFNLFLELYNEIKNEELYYYD